MPFTVKKVALAATFSVLSLAPLASWALGLGRLNVQSALGEPLRADIEVTSITPEETASLQARVASPETYRAAGVDYNQVLAATSITLQRGADGRAYLRLTSDRAVTEPFVDAILDLAWSSGRLVREYTLLFDPPSANRTAAAPITPLTMDTPPAPRPPAPAPSRPPAPPAVVAAPAPVPPAVQPPAPVRPPAPQPAVRPVPPPEAPAPRIAAPSEGESTESKSVKVRSGDTLSAIAERNLQQGVALDQMIVGLYRANPRAFQGNNMNRLKSGVVLNVPSASQAQAVSSSEARQIIVAQSADFAAYRERLAGSVTESVGGAQQRQASGKIEAEVQDRQRAAAPAPDKLTLSKGGMASGTASSPEDRLAKARADQESSTRVAELSRNLDELRKLKEKAPVVAAKPAPAPVAPPPPPPPPPPAPVPVPPPPPVAAPASVPAPAPVASAAVASASVPEQAASTPDMSASGAATAVADAASEAPVEASAPMVPTIPKPVQIPVPAAEPEAPGFFESVDPMLLLGAGAGIVLLAAGGLYLRSRRRPDGAETSFLESRLQPDSFFGASGGQRVDTRDATGGPSSMSYSLSQLDAIGDVDPVAEADVYLAYGRDLQAEEILKEALRGNPDRLAIRTKLLEVYAKRRDTKGFEQLAGQLFGMTGGQGEDWLRAQEMGLSIDPENPLYQPGGQPAVNTMSEPQYREPLGASTVPLSEMPPLQDTMPVAPEPSVDDLGLDLDISAPAPLADEPASPVRPTAPVFSSALDLPPLTQAPAPAPALNDDLSLDFDLPLEPAAPAAAPAPAAAAPSPAPTAPMEFDLSGINLDLGDADVPDAGGEVISGDDMPPLDAPADDPLARKLELAEEFRHIGDVDGARELLQEVIASAEGATRAKAQAMLDDLT